MRHAVQDPYFAFACRPIDHNWHYAGFDVMGGFNPIVHTYFYSVTSPFRKWLEDPVYSGRALNHDDELAKQVLVMAHDYLHSWAYRALAHLEPHLGVEDVPITSQNLDYFTYVHLLTEAAAVVGLDYWYLCVKGVDQRCSLGSLLGPRTVEYRERYISEYRRFCPQLEVQSPNFFFEIVKLFCSDEFEGFSLADVVRSPALAAWVIREVKAAHSQRVVTRLWLGQFAGIRLSDSELRRPLRAPSGRRKRLAIALGELLWNKIKRGVPFFFPTATRKQPWRYPSQDVTDFRFTNLQRSLPRAYDWISLPAPRENFAAYAKQHVARFRFPVERPQDFPKKFKREFTQLLRTFDQRGLEALTSDLSPVDSPTVDPAPMEMILLG